MTKAKYSLSTLNVPREQEQEQDKE